MTAARLRAIAAILLALALALIGAMHYASQRMIAIQGPGAMQAVGPQSLWVSVNEELWVLDASGRRTARRSAAQLGLSAAVSNIVPAPDGQVLLTSREDLRWQVVDRAGLAPVRTIEPQWPPQLRDHTRGAIHLAISPDWEIAVATGGGHAVLLFDRDGRFLRRSAPGLYRFTNGLWHSPDGWWTTDTNSFRLRLLDTTTLELKQTIGLKQNPLPYAYLGELAPSQGAAQPGTGQRPLATVSRLGALMEPGHVVDVFPDGSQAVYNREPFGIVRDLAWFNGELLAIDGAKYEIARFSPRREALGRFGDAGVTTELDALLRERQRWAQLSSRTLFLPAALLLLLGIAAYSRSKTAASDDAIVARSPFAIGTPPVAPGRLRRQWLVIVALPYLLRVASVFALVFWLPGFARPWLRAGGLLWPGPWGALLSNGLLLLWLPLLAWISLERRLFTTLSVRPQWEALLNRRAVAWLARHDDFDRLARPGELPRESVLLAGWRPRWLLVTNQRILLFAAGARERRLLAEWPRGSVAHVLGHRPLPAGRLARLWQRWFRWRVNIHVRFGDGTLLEGFAPSQVTADRVVALLAATAAANGVADASEAAPQRRYRRWHEVIASALVPGLGQLLQDRFASGAVLLTAAGLLLMLLVGPVLWAASGPKMDVAPATILASVAWWLLLAAAGALDAWHFAAARRGISRAGAAPARRTR